MRLLFVTPYYFPELKFGGPPKRIHSLARGLTNRGHQVRVVTFHSEEPRAADERCFDGVPVQYLPWLGKSLRQVPLRLSILHEEIRAADVVHCYGLYNLLCPAAAYSARRQGTPYFLEPMGMYVPRVSSLGWKKFYHTLFTNRMAHGAEAVVATSELERDELAGLGGSVRLMVRRNGINVEEFAKLPPASEMRDRWGIKAGERVILYLGRISAKKRVEELVRAFRAAQLDKTRLVIAGPVEHESYADRVRSLVGPANVARDVILEGPLYERDHKAALAAADLFVLPSLNENFGNAAAEAVAAGVPVLLTETCGVAPLINQRAGLAIPLGLEALAEGIKTMLDPTEAERLTARREEVKRDLSWDDPIRQTEKLYEKALRGRSPMRSNARTVD